MFGPFITSHKLRFGPFYSCRTAPVLHILKAMHLLVIFEEGNRAGWDHKVE